MTVSKIEMDNFKCFKALDFPCSPLTLLTGYNAAGKSTVLQALLLLAQGLRLAPSSNLLPLNGDVVALGSAGDVICHGSDDQILHLGVSGRRESAHWQFGYRKDLSARGLMQVTDVLYSDDGNRRELAHQIFPAELAQSSLIEAVRDTVFIGAARGGQGALSSVPQEQFQQAGNVGLMGQYSAYWYLECADDEVDPLRRHPSDDRETVRSQVDAWMNELFPGARVSADRLTADAPAQLAFSLSRNSPWSKPANVGFGLNYAFPMVVALLTSRTGSIVVVDSAEAHLHPRAQSAVGRFLAQMARAGVQIFLESHSDHLLNGIRLAVREGLLMPDDATVHFFGAGERIGSITTLSIDRTGAISDWPAGFFDQSEHDLSTLAGWN